MEKLDWCSERVLRAAIQDSLPHEPMRLDNGVFVPNLNDYVIGWAAMYLLSGGDRGRDELQAAWRAWEAWMKRKEGRDEGHLDE